ncbi:MAG TPA: glycosyltransferase family 39 protein, partial [bacterium]
YEHPPMVAWLIRGLSYLFGNSEAGLEAMAVTTNLAILVALYALAVRTFGIGAANFTFLAVESSAYFTLGTPMLQIEQPLLLSWIGALAALLEYQRTGKPRWLLVMGVCAGLGALSKYTMLLFYFGGLAYLLLVPERRKDLRSPWLYAAGTVSLLVFSPVLIWNAQHNWFSFRFQLGKAGGATEAFLGKHLIEFTVGYIILFSPVAVLAGARPVWRRLRELGRADRPEVLLAVLGAVPIAFFSLAMIRGSFPDPKWANVGFLSYFLLLGAVLNTLWEAGRRLRVKVLVGGALAVNVAVIAIVGLQTWKHFFKAPEGGDPTEQIVGWNLTVQQVEGLLFNNRIPPPRYVISAMYPLASQFALHMASRPLTYSLKRPERNLWSPKADMQPEDTLFVCSGRECRWGRRLIRAQLGWDAQQLGIVTTTLWGVRRHQVEVWLLVPGAPKPAAPRS